MKRLTVFLSRYAYSFPFSPAPLPPLPLSIILSPSSFHHALLFSSGIYRVAPDASASLLRWSLAHACFRLGSLCSSFAFSLVLLPPPPPPCRQPFVYPSLSEVGRLLRLCIYTPHLFFLFPFIPHCIFFLSVSAPFHLPLLITPPPPLTPPFLSPSQRVSTCLSSSRSLTLSLCCHGALRPCSMLVFFFQLKATNL